jgi:hypothetical protein
MITDLVDIASLTIRQTIERAVMRVMTMFIALISGLVAIGFLTAAGYQALRYRWSAPEALLIVGGSYLLLAIIVLVVARMVDERAAKAPRPSVSRVMTGHLPDLLGQVASSVKGMVASSRPTAEPLTTPLHDTAGEKATPLGPFQRVLTALLTGYLVGRVIDRRIGT